jgi:nitronate monooxygenase
VNTRADIENLIAVGFSGVQVGTRFICTAESGMALSGQQVYIDATNDDVVIIKSPVGLPVRVLRTPLVERVLDGSHEVFTCPFKCLLTCDMKTVPFCIAKALLSARAGDRENGLFMTGANVGAINETISVSSFFKSLE